MNNNYKNYQFILTNYRSRSKKVRNVDQKVKLMFTSYGS